MDAVKLYGFDGDKIRRIYIDEDSNSLVTIDHEHYGIHAGQVFSFSDSVTINSSGTQEYIITTPALPKKCHLSYRFDGTAITKFEIFRATTKVGTTLQSTPNRDANSANVPLMTLHKDSSGSGDGTLIFTYNSGSASSQSKNPSLSRADQEIILKADSKYLIRITSGTAGNLVNFGITWDEHDDTLLI